MSGMDLPQLLLTISVVAIPGIFAITMHEVAHGWAATTVAGGEVVYHDGEIVAERHRGRYLPRTA